MRGALHPRPLYGFVTARHLLAIAGGVHPEEHVADFRTRNRRNDNAHVRKAMEWVTVYIDVPRF